MNKKILLWKEEIILERISLLFYHLEDLIDITVGDPGPTK